MLLLLGAFNYTCSAGRQVKTVSGKTILIFNDTLLDKKHSPNKTSKTVLHEETKVKSTAITQGDITFNLGLIDYEGNGSFKDENDLLVITHPQNRMVRIMAEFGDPHCPLTDPVYFRVDSTLFKLSDISLNGNTGNLINLGKSGNMETASVITLNNRVKGFKFKKYSGGESLLDTIFDNKPLTYIYFWNTYKLEYQMNKLENIYKNYPGKVRIIGVHCKEHELDKASQANFFELVAKPWNGYYCDTEQYKALCQDYSFYRGLLVDNGGKIIFPHISPKELEDWLANHP